MWTRERPFGKISVETVGVKTDVDVFCKCEIFKINLYENHGILLFGNMFYHVLFCLYKLYIYLIRIVTCTFPFA